MKGRLIMKKALTSLFLFLALVSFGNPLSAAEPTLNQVTLEHVVSEPNGSLQSFRVEWHGFWKNCGTWRRHVHCPQVLSGTEGGYPYMVERVEYNHDGSHARYLGHIYK